MKSLLYAQGHWLVGQYLKEEKSGEEESQVELWLSHCGSYQIKNIYIC